MRATDGACPDDLDGDVQGDASLGLSLLQRHAHATSVQRERASYPPGAPWAKNQTWSFFQSNTTSNLSTHHTSELITKASSLVQSNTTAKLSAHTVSELTTKAFAVPVILIVLALVAMTGFLVMMMMHNTSDSEKSPPPVPPAQQTLWSAGAAQKSKVPQHSPQVPSLMQSSPHAAAMPESASSMASSVCAPRSGLGEELGKYVPPPSAKSESGHMGPHPKAPMTSTAIIVRSPEGVILQPDYKCAPNPEQLHVNFRSLKGANAVVRAQVDELGGQRRIMVESASGIPLAVIDTSCAIYPTMRDAPPRDTRRANIHRVAGSSFQLLGSPCATVLSVAPDVFVVLNASSGGLQDLRANVEQLKHSVQANGFAQRPDVLLTVRCDGYGCIQDMRDGRGGIVARQESTSASATEQSNIWVSQGGDITLIVTVLLAVWKLA